jgi:hypothetical protein
MEYAFLSGIFLKFYDDFVDDEPYITNEHIVTILRYLQVALLTLLLSSDFTVALLFLSLNITCAVSSFKEYSTPHVFAHFFFCPLTLIASWKKGFQSFHGLDFLILPMIFIGALLEPRLVPEEISISKWITRFVASLLATIFAVAFPFSQSVKLFFMGAGGYTFASSIAQMLKLTLLPRLNSGSDMKSV